MAITFSGEGRGYLTRRRALRAARLSGLLTQLSKAHQHALAAALTAMKALVACDAAPGPSSRRGLSIGVPARNSTGDEPLPGARPLCQAIFQQTEGASPMRKVQWRRLRRSSVGDLGRWAGGSAVSDPLGLLAVEQERRAAARSPRHDTDPPAAADQGTGPCLERS